MMTNDNPENPKNDGEHGHASEREQSRELVSSLADGQLRGLEFARAVSLVTDSGEARATWHAYHVLGDVLRSGELAACADDAAFVARLRVRLELQSVGQAPTLAPEAVRARVGNGPGDHAVVDTKTIAGKTYGTVAGGIYSLNNASANESPFRWKMLAGVASVAAMGAIGWSMVGGMAGPGIGNGLREGASPTAAQLAQNSAPTQSPAQAQLQRQVPPQVPSQVSPQLQAQTEQQQEQQQQQPPVMIRDPHLDALLAAHKQFGGTSALQMPAGFLRNATFESPVR